MATQVKVTPAQVRAAQTLVERATESGDILSPAVLKLASALPMKTSVDDGLWARTLYSLTAILDKTLITDEAELAAVGQIVETLAKRGVSDATLAHVWEKRSPRSVVLPDGRKVGWGDEVVHALLGPGRIVALDTNLESIDVAFTRNDVGTRRFVTKLLMSPTVQLGDAAESLTEDEFPGSLGQ